VNQIKIVILALSAAKGKDLLFARRDRSSLASLFKLSAAPLFITYTRARHHRQRPRTVQQFLLIKNRKAVPVSRDGQRNISSSLKSG
jgi:hypothetical protein